MTAPTVERSLHEREGHPLRVVIGDDHPLLRVGIRASLELDGGFEVVGETSSGPRVLPLVSQLAPDVVLLNMHMPDLDGIGCLDRIVDRYPEVKVVMCSGVSDPTLIQAALRHGAAGYVVTTIDANDLGAAIRQAVTGTSFQPVGPASLDDETPARELGLTDRELEILRAVTRGLPNKAIAKELWITEQTVKFHLGNAFKKLGVTNRTEAARWTIGVGLERRSLLEI
jgi:DNA-binding NarL/FixJ family response regulator